VSLRVCPSSSTNSAEPNQDVTLRDAVLHAWARSIATTWIVSTGLAGVALILTLFLQEHSGDVKNENAESSEKPQAEEVQA
jgi:hypothetical protein